jgi:hypothetical protein
VPFELFQALTLSNTHISRLWRQKAFFKSVKTDSAQARKNEAADDE